MTKRILVTGGAGFIGSHLVDYLLEAGNDVLVYDDFSYGKQYFLPSHEKLQVVSGNLLDERLLLHQVHHFSPHVIFHLAALHHIPTCEKHPATALKINIDGTQNLLDAAKDIPELERLVFASSGAVYDLLDEPLEEHMSTVPYDIYSVSKLAGEQQVRLWANKYGRQAFVARIFNTIGGRETNDHLVPDIVVQMLAGKTSIELGNLEPLRTYIDVRDTAKGIQHIGSLKSDAIFDLFNVGREDEFSVKQMVEILKEVSGVSFNIIQNPARVRKVDRRRQLASIKKLHVACGWSPVYSVADGLKYAFDFAREKRIR